MLVELSLSLNESTMLIGWNFWSLNGPLLTGSLSTSMVVRLTFSLKIIH